MTLVEFNIRMEAYQLSQVDELRNMAQQAFFNQAVKATKSGGKKPMYRKVDDLFNAEEAAHNIRSAYGYEPPTEKELEIQGRAHAAERLKEYYKNKEKAK